MFKTDYCLWVRHYYYAGTYGAPIDGWQTDGCGNVAEYCSRQAAQGAADSLGDHGGVYHLAHGEYAAPDYTVKVRPLL